MRLLTWTLPLLLLLTALALPGTAAEGCPQPEVWAVDDDDDVYELPEDLNGGMDILEMRIGEAGDDCSWFLVGITVDDPALVDPAIHSGPVPEGPPDDPNRAFDGPASQRVVLDLALPEGSPAVQLHYVWSLRYNTPETGTDHVGWWAELYVAGEKVSDTFDDSNDVLADDTEGGRMDIRIAKDQISFLQVLGANATAHEDGHDAYAEFDGPGYSPDSLAATEIYTLGYGIGVPPVEEVAVLEPDVEVGAEPETPDIPEAAAQDHDAMGNGTADEVLDESPTDKESPGVALPVFAVAMLVAALRRR